MNQSRAFDFKNKISDCIQDFCSVIILVEKFLILKMKLVSS